MTTMTNTTLAAPPQVAVVDENQIAWYAVRVKSRFEFAVSRTLSDKGYEEFLPLCESRRVWSDRVKRIEMPIFPGYLFCRFRVSEMVGILNAPGVVHVVSAGKRPLAVDDEEIACVQAMCRSGVMVEPWAYLNVGDRCMVERGPLAGTEGFIVALKGAYRLVVSISLLQRAVAAEIDRDCVRRAA